MDLLEDLTTLIHCQDFGVSLCLEGDVGHTNKCQLKKGLEMSLSTHFGMECMRFKDSLLGHRIHTLAVVWISTTRSLSNTFQLPTLVTHSVPCCESGLQHGASHAVRPFDLENAHIDHI